MQGKSLVFLCMLAALLAVLGTGRAAQTEAVGEITFTGRVLDARGNALADVKVARHEVVYGESVTSLRAELAEEVRTAGDGAFTFTTSAYPGFRVSFVIARKEGFAWGWAAWEMDQSRQVDITLGEPKELGGEVVDEGGNLLADARVGIAVGIIGDVEERHYLTVLATPNLLTTTTDGRGRFVFPSMPADATFELVACKPGRAVTCTFDPATYSWQKCQFVAGQTGIRLVLPPEAGIEGKVVKKTDGQPVGGIRVIATRGRQDYYVLSAVGPAVSAPDGTFRIGGLPAGQYTVQLTTTDERVAQWLAEPRHVSLQTGQTGSEVTLELIKGGLLEVLVKEGATDTRIEGADVRFEELQSRTWHNMQTDANGVAQIRLLPGEYELATVHKQGYARWEGRAPFIVEQDRTVRLEQTLAGLPTVTGVVYDAGEPVEGAQVHVMPGSGGLNPSISDAEGRFAIAWDPGGWSPQAVHCLFARHRERNLAVVRRIDEDDKRVELELMPAAALTGIVADPNDRPIAGAEIRVMLHVSTWSSTFEPGADIRTDAEGRFEIPVLPPEQHYRVTARAEGYGQDEIDAIASGRVHVGRLELRVADMSVSGTVVDAEGKPVPGAMVSCDGRGNNGQPDRRTETDEAGKFTLDGVCAGRLRIDTSSRIGPTSVYGSVETEAGARDVQIVVAERSAGSSRYVPRKPTALKGRPLPDLRGVGVELPADANDRMLLVCFWDMNQRPSRHCVTQLARRAAQLEAKGVAAVLVQAAATGEGALEEWAQNNDVPFVVGRIAGDVEKTRFDWGAVSLPHLILMDKERKVVAEGFNLSELDGRIEAAAGR